MSTRQHLRELIRSHGAGVYASPSACEALLQAAGGHPTEISVLVAAVAEGVPARLLQSRTSRAAQRLIVGLTTQLQHDRGLSEAAAQWAVESWALALGVLPAPKPHRVTPPTWAGVLVGCVVIIAVFLVARWRYGLSTPPIPSTVATARLTPALHPGPHRARAPRPEGNDLSALVGQMAYDAEVRGVAGYIGVYLAPAERSGRAWGAWRAGEDFPAASVIKVPVMLATYDAWADGSVRRRAAHEAMLRRMIQESSNPDTNALVDVLGLPRIQESTRRALGNPPILVTVMERKLSARAPGPPRNRACPWEVARLLTVISERERSGDANGVEMLTLLQGTSADHRTRIPAGIPEPYRARTANKTGTLSAVVNDCAIVERPGGERYVLCIFMESVASIPAAESWARNLSAAIWQRVGSPHVRTPLGLSTPVGVLTF